MRGYLESMFAPHAFEVLRFAELVAENETPAARRGRLGIPIFG